MSRSTNTAGPNKFGLIYLSHWGRCKLRQKIFNCIFNCVFSTWIGASNSVMYITIMPLLDRVFFYRRSFDSCAAFVCSRNIPKADSNPVYSWMHGFLLLHVIAFLDASMSRSMRRHLILHRESHIYLALQAQRTMSKRAKIRHRAFWEDKRKQRDNAANWLCSYLGDILDCSGPASEIQNRWNAGPLMFLRCAKCLLGDGIWVVWLSGTGLTPRKEPRDLSISRASSPLPASELERQQFFLPTSP